MALKPCRECKREVSDQAKTCPHCGSPVPSSNAAVRVLVSLVLFAAIAVWAFSGFFDSSSAIGKLTNDRSFTLLVHCTPGLSFRGTYMTFKASGSSSTNDASGRCPSNGIVTFSAFGTIVSASVQKQEERGTLGLEIAQTGGVTLVRSETRDPFGLVTAASP